MDKKSGNIYFSIILVYWTININIYHAIQQHIKIFLYWGTSPTGYTKNKGVVDISF